MVKLIAFLPFALVWVLNLRTSSEFKQAAKEYVD